MRNFVKDKLKRGEISIGTWNHIGHPDISERLAKFGFEWIIFDMEHGPLDIQIVQSMMQSMSYTDKCVPIVRVAWNDAVLIKRALDIGAYGILAPWVNSKEEASNLVRACKYPPEGIRGFGPRRVEFLDKDYVRTANDEVLIIAQIETEKAIENLDEIFSVKGIDACIIGRNDLSMSLGIFRQLEHPRLKDALKKVLVKCREWNIVPGMVCSDENIGEAVSQGFRFCSIGEADSFLRKGALDSLKKARESLSQIGEDSISVEGNQK